MDFSTASSSILFNGGTLVYGDSVTVDLSARLNHGSSSSGYRIDTGANSVTFEETIGASSSTSSADFTKLGSGTLTLSASSGGYSSSAEGIYLVGNVFVDNGVLIDNGFTYGSASSSSRLPSSVIDIASNATFQAFDDYSALGIQGLGTLQVGSNFEVLHDGADYIFDGSITGGSSSSTFVKRSNSTLSLGGNNSFFGEVVIDNGILSIDSEQALGNASLLRFNGISSVLDITEDSSFPSTLSIESDASSSSHFNITVAESKSATFDGSFSCGDPNPCDLFKDGRGSLILNATNTFTGFVNIANGILSISLFRI